MKPIEENLRRAAILVLNLDDATAEKVLEHLPEEDAARVRRIMVELQTIDGDEERQVLRDFLRRRPAAMERDTGVELQLGAGLRASSGSPSPVVSTSDGNKPFRFLQAARGEKITSFIAGEHPQTIAVVVSHLSDDRAAAVLATLDGDLQAEVIQRLIDLDQADPEVLREVEAGLESRMLEEAQAQRRQESGLESVVRILDAAEPELRRNIMVNLSRHDRQLAERLRPQQFEFDDLRHVNDATLTTIFAAAGMEVARLALAGADDLVERLIKPLSPAEAKKMRRMIERLGPVRLTDVEAAQCEVARVACQLALEGTVDLPIGQSRLAMA